MPVTVEKAASATSRYAPANILRKSLGQNTAVALSYLLTAKLGLLLALEQTNATAVWPPTGIALAGCLAIGFRVWPGIFIGAFLSNIIVLAVPFSSLPALLLSLATAAGNTLEALAAAYLVRRFITAASPFDRTLDTLRFILLAAVAGPVISATIGSAGFGIYSSDWPRFGQMWLTWWLGDAVGVLVFAPLLLTWKNRGTRRDGRWQAAEAAAILALLLLAEIIIFPLNFHLEYLIIPLLFWTAFRFGQFETAVTVALVMLSFLLWTVNGFGPFAGTPISKALLFLQSYLGVASASTLLLSALVTSRSRAEEALRASEEKFRHIFENAPVGIFQSTADGRFIGLNVTLAAMFGYSSPEEMIREVTDIAAQIFISPDQRYAIVAKARDAAGFIREEVVYRRRDRTEFIANIYMRMLRDKSGTASRVEGFVEDITERKHAEERLREYRNNLEAEVSLRTAELQRTNERLTGEIEERARAQQLLVERESQYRDLVESANSVILRWLPDGRITFFNRFAQHFFGYSEDEIINRNILGTVVPLTDTAGHDLTSLAADIVAHPENYVRNVNENIRKDGERVWVAWTNRPIPGADGTVAEILSIGVDITQLVNTERELRHTLDELALAKERAEAADRMKSAFLATMSHELRTPLNSIIGFTGILLQGLGGPVNEEQSKQLTMVKSSAHHLLSLISDVLDISKIEAGQLQVTAETFNLQASIVKVVQSVRPLADKKGLALTLDMADDVGSVCADERRVEQILLNLLSNAVKFTDQGTVSVRCFREAGDYVTTVTDTGIGIKEEDLERLFQPFHQIDTGLTRKYEGTGLGLSICKKMVELMGGSIRVKSSPGKGSTFAFTLSAERNAA